MSKVNASLPASWRLSTLGAYVADGSRGIVPNKTPKATFELYSVPSFEGGSPEIITGAEIGSNKQIVDEGTVLLCKINPRINRSWVVGSFSNNPKIASTEWITFPPNDDFEPKYLFYYLKQDHIRDYLAGNVSGVGGSLMRVKSATIKDYSFPIAPKNDQKSIVAEIEKQFSRLDEAVANLKRVKASLKRYKGAVLKAAVEGKLTEEWRMAHPEVEPAGELLKRILIERKKKWSAENPGKKYNEPTDPETSKLSELPGGWTWSRSDQLFNYVTSGSRGWARYYSETGAAFLRMGNLDHDTINLDLSDIQRVQPPKDVEGSRTRVLLGDILISITADVGMVGTVPTDFEEAYINQHVALARPTTAANHVYLAWFLAGKNGQDQLQKLQRGATKVGLGLDDIKSVDVPLPPAKEQNEIVSEIERHFSIVGDVEAEVDINLKRAEKLRQTILRQAYLGKI